MALSIPPVRRQFKTAVATALTAQTITKICNYLGYR
jgi:hypothetical protein